MRKSDFHTYPTYGWEDIQKSLATHKLTIVKNDGLHRHLKFRRSDNTIDQWFEIVTWPDVLTIHGDMGTYVFSRLEDMFQFFREGKDHRINPSYWAEKVRATESRGLRSGHYDFSERLARNAVAREVKYLRDLGASNEVCRDFLDFVSYDSLEDHYQSVNEWEWDEFNVNDYWEANLQEHTYSFIWCLHAIVWGIQQFDLAQDLNVSSI